MKIEILDEVEQDLVDGYLFYERQSPGLGDYFVDSVTADIESLVLYGGTHSKRFGYQRMLAKRFPFAIYYRTEGDTCRVFGVLDCRRSPVRLRRQLRPR